MPSFDYLIKQHGNQFLTGAPFLHGSVPHIDFFQWGNLFGVIKYLELDHELKLINNVLPSPIITAP